MAAKHKVTLRPQILGKLLLHYHRRLLRHGIEMLEQLRQQLDPVHLRHTSRLHAILVILKSLLHRETGHPDIDARLVLQSRALPRRPRSHLSGRFIEQHDINAVMQTRFASGFEFSK